MKNKQTTKPQFTWHKIDSELKVKQFQNHLNIPLKPNMIIALKSSTDCVIQTRLHIDIDKSLQYQNDIGWNWHKSSNLPIFTLKLSILNNLARTILTPPKLQAKIYAVKIVENTFKKGQNLYLEDIGIKGNSQIQLVQGCGSFNSLRFCSTSYNNQGVKFHLLIIIYNGQNDSEIPNNIVCSVISPPIFVDSRKSARNYQEKKYLSFVELFNPDELEKLFSIKDNKEQPEETRIINNNDEGFYNYLTAPNIRHKVKHPLFLSVRFSNAFKIYVNVKSKYFCRKQITLNSVINRLQKKLINEVGVMRRQRQVQDANDKQFVILLKFQTMVEQKNKIIQMIEYLDCHSILLTDRVSIMNDDFVNIFQLGDIISIYKHQYFNLKKKSENQISERKTLQVNKQQKNISLSKNNPELGIKYKVEQKFSQSNQSENQDQTNKYQQQVKEIKSMNMRDLGMALKKVKLNEEQFFNSNPHLIKYQMQQNFPQTFIDDQMMLQKQKYQAFIFDYRNIGQSQNIKKEEQFINIYVSQRQVVQKIQHMCIQVYQRNKKSILTELQILKKSNIKWKVKDIQYYIFSQSSALMNAIFFRQKLLHHMLLQNQILKAKVGMMQQMSISDLQAIKCNIMSMNKFLPQKFIMDQIKHNQLDFNNENGTLQMTEIKHAEVKSNQSEQKKAIEQRDCNKEKMIEQESSSEVNESIPYECKFVSNVFDLESSSVQQ